ncbi:hypothetical protein B5P45_02770 [Phyllobacterium zundukense]|uniref:Uncharacterized protein n=1 Tax=Phyllobacterium zundukense TaxID=1867719 RepID=A0A2N9W4S1_9HYPH|nr:hypothetical protein BLM14_09305 [Phyllobacterium zundukense]PIO46739.1 hypothetical protein B5P45_02770 [Phyllobacterium zundukense]
MKLFANWHVANHADAKDRRDRFMFILLAIAMMIAMMVSAFLMLIEENKKRKAPVRTSRFGVYHHRIDL